MKSKAKVKPASDHRREDPAFEVGDPDVAGDRADRVIAPERGNHPGQRIRLQQRVAVHRYENFAGTAAEPLVERITFAVVFRVGDHPDAAAGLFRRLLHPAEGVVDAAVVDGDDFELVGGIFAAADAFECELDGFALVVGGNDDGTDREFFRRHRRNFPVEKIPADRDQQEISQWAAEKEKREGQRKPVKWRILLNPAVIILGKHHSRKYKNNGQDHDPAPAFQPVHDTIPDSARSKTI